MTESHHNLKTVSRVPKHIQKRIQMRYYSNKISRKQSPQDSGNVRSIKNSKKQRGNKNTTSSKEFDFSFRPARKSQYSSVQNQETRNKKEKIKKSKKKAKSKLFSLEKICVMERK
mmetsp:Transcript_32245/g.28563  ORF Transcript_32245/g.28563 Transcript_32245/m.28563 type:complete len:115 (+) Transcript_32245:321-665(+)